MLTTASIAELTSATLIGSGDLQISGVEAADIAQPGQLTFVRTRAFADAWRTGRATAALVSQDLPLQDVWQGFTHEQPRAILVVRDADLAMISVLERMTIDDRVDWSQGTLAGPFIHSTAVVHASVKLAENVSIGPGCVVGAGCTIGPGAVLTCNISVGNDVSIGAGTRLSPNVTLYARSRVGARCILHAGVVIGADGFGYHPSPDGRGAIKIPHIGNVVLGDDVEIGANSSVDRAKFGSTTIGSGTKIDNLVQIGHNCRVGRGCILCGQVGLAGSVTLGDGVTLGGRVAVADNISIGARASVAGYSGVMGDVPPGEAYMGVPAGPAGEWRRIYAFLRKLGKNRGRTT